MLILLPHTGVLLRPVRTSQASPLAISRTDDISDQPPAMKLQADDEASKEWVYPLNHPKRDYQYNIVRNSLFENSLVALPTGLGKTFIAGVIMLNCKLDRMMGAY